METTSSSLGHRGTRQTWESDRKGTESSGFEDFIGTSPSMRELYRIIRKVGPSTASVFLVGESGTGKELAAKLLHRLSGRRGPFVAVNCGAIPETLLEGELFGHEKGAFTGATHRQAGCFEMAHQGTLFLDELPAMPLSSQTKLLRALEEKSFRRLRGKDELSVDVRVVAATNQSPEHALRDGRLREDLLFRINVFTLELPPLRERPSDIPLLARHFIDHFSRANGKSLEGLDPEAERLIRRHPWPGNVRELRNAIERSVILAAGSHIRPEDLPASVRAHEEPPDERTSERGGTAMPHREDTGETESLLRVGMTIEEATRSLMLRTLEATGYNKTKTARLLGVSAKTVYNKLKEWSRNGDQEARLADARARGGAAARSDRRSSEAGGELVSIEEARKRRIS